MALTGSRFSLTVETGRALTAKDVLGSDSEVDLSLVVTTGTGIGTRRTIRLGAIPPPGERTTLVGSDSACASGCRLAAVELTASPGVDVDGDLDLSDLRVDGRPVDWGTSPEDWNTTEDEHAVIRPSSTASECPPPPAGHPGHLSRRAHPGLGAPHDPRTAARRSP